MNYYQAARRKDGRFDYTCTNDNVTWPVGYCRPFLSFDANKVEAIFGKQMVEWFRNDHDKLSLFRDKYHEHGHATAEEACACYRQYQIDNKLVINMKPLNDDDRPNHRKCGISSNSNDPLHECGKWTQNVAAVGGWWHIHLCDEHCNKETVEKLFPKVGSSASS